MGTTATRWIGGLAVAGALALTSCGVSGDEQPAVASTTTAEMADAPSRADFLEAANEICRNGRELLAGKEPSTSEEDELVTYLLDTFVPAVRKQVADIRALGFPPGDEAELTAIFDATADGLDRIEADPVAVIGPGADLFDAVNDQLNAYGLTECGGS